MLIRKIHLVYLLVRKGDPIFRRPSRNHDWMKGKEDMEVAPWCASSLVFMQRSGRAFTANMWSSPFNIHIQRGRPTGIYNSITVKCPSTWNVMCAILYLKLNRMVEAIVIGSGIFFHFMIHVIYLSTHIHKLYKKWHTIYTSMHLTFFI